MSTAELDIIANNIKDYLNKNSCHLLSGEALNSPRSVGDAVQVEIAENAMPSVLGKFGINVKDNFSRRSMEDLAFFADDKYYAVDVKTHNLSTDFNMPNLISVKRLANFYKNDDKNNFCIIIVSYKITNNEIYYTNCHFKPIENFDWECLTLGALGWGQIQIANANRISFADESRKEWMLKLCEKVELFYNEEIGKIGERISWFSQMREYWRSK